MRKGSRSNSIEGAADDRSAPRVSHSIYFFFTLESTARKNEWGLKDEANKYTGEKEFLVHPMACNVCCVLVFIGLAGWGVPAIAKRIKQPKPTEEEKKK